MKNNNLEERFDKLEAENKKTKKQLGITLVALVVTMIVMLILAAVTVAQLSGNGLFDRTKLAKEKYKNSEETQDSILSQYQEEIEKIGSARDFSLDKVYPIGSIYITTSNENPTNTIGGTWESFGEGRTLIGAGTGTDSNNQAETFAVNATGGEYKHTLTVAEMPSHTHTLGYGIETAGWSGNSPYRYIVTNGNRYGAAPESAEKGENAAHNIIQPYIVTYMWKRTA